jgi:hypothetical protein
MKLVTVLVIAAVGASPTFAKNISITVAPTVTVSPGTVSMRLKVSNGGDEAAQSVQPILRFRDKEAKGAVHASLGPNEIMEDSLKLDVGDLGPGRWPFRLTIDYTDANQYPFQALQMIPVLVGTPAAPKLSISDVKAQPLTTTAGLSIRVKNLSATPRKVTLAAFVPEGLEVSSQPAADQQLEGWADKLMSATLLNRTALAGSRYPVYVVAEYEDEGTHQTVLSQGIVEIVEQHSFFERQRNLLWIAAATIAGLWVLVALFRVVTRPRATAAR